MKLITIGTFDILHFGHIAFLRACQQLSGGDLMTVGLNTDRFVTEYKGRPPVMDYAEREHALAQLRYNVVPNDGPGRALVEAERAGMPMILAIGSDWSMRNYLAQIDVDQHWLDERRITVAYIPYTLGPPISTSEIRRRVLERAGEIW